MPGRGWSGLIQSPYENGRAGMIDIVAIKVRFETLAPYRDERARRLFAATKARAAGRGGVAVVSEATGVARSTIGRGLAELRSEHTQLTRRIRRPGGGRKPKIETEPELLEHFEFSRTHSLNW